MPPAAVSLRLLAFAVSAGLAAAAIQPLLAALVGGVPAAWAISVTGPSLLGVGVIFLADRLSDRGAHVPPWYSAWLLLPGAFLLAGAAAMCLVAAIVPIPAVRLAGWEMLGTGAVLWTAALLWVRGPAQR